MMFPSSRPNYSVINDSVGLFVGFPLMVSWITYLKSAEQAAVLVLVY